MRRPRGRGPIERLLRPIEDFAAIQSSSGLVLLACAVAGMAVLVAVPRSGPSGERPEIRLGRGGSDN